MAYKVKKNSHRLRKALIIFVIIVAVVGVGALLVVRRIYTENLRAVTPDVHTQVVVAIPAGSSLNQIAQILKTKQVIRADWAFKQYVRSHELGDKLKAGTYRLYSDENVGTIANFLVAGKVAVDLFTILPGQRIDQIRKTFIDAGFTAADVDKALDANNYAGHAALVDKPAAASLEGYLYPDSFQRTADTSPTTIVVQSLDEMASYLTADLRSAYAAENLTTYQAITLASIVEREVASQEDRATAAQVFLTRIKQGMRLQSDVTVIYGMALAGKDTSIVDTSFASPYNTFLHDGLPVGPISNVTKSGLQAVAHPSSTDYLYFVAGDGSDYGKTYFSKTIAEHQAAVAAHCKTCAQQ
ncbi:MAG: hypothetical protein JWO47_249 [Candidatus Saccharibacteria bacterium]|nr:hypothetical protein [Candidatus Saccharibacteria bacterium]